MNEFKARKIGKQLFKYRLSSWHVRTTYLDVNLEMHLRLFNKIISSVRIMWLVGY
jgi:hypothetical protein